MRKPPLPPTFDKIAPLRGACVWCGHDLKRNKDGAISKVRRWHEACALEHAITQNPSAARVQVFLRDMGCCATTGKYCGPARVRPLKHMPHEEALAFWHQLQSNEPVPSRSTDFKNWEHRATTFHQKLWKDCRFRGSRWGLGSWQLDHIVPLWSIQNMTTSEQHKFYSIDNMQTLSPDAHHKKTVEEAVERAKLKRVFN